jgi:hypothetical protein
VGCAHSVISLDLIASSRSIWRDIGCKVRSSSAGADRNAVAGKHTDAVCRSSSSRRRPVDAQITVFARN